ncbi:MAG: PQQ-binding-like beta-propeller repeat protein [Acidobacteria bacterium]|nr:PQQ-binding-like beta-propeller repeat protein [Acidobacteriota bacterium]
MRPLTLLLLTTLAQVPSLAADPTWPQFRGPLSNPTAPNGRLPDHWSTTQNVEWSTPIPGRGWSSPIVAGSQIFLTAAVTDGPSKQPQMGTDYSNQYTAELRKQGLSAQEAFEKVRARDKELPHEVMLHYFLYCLDLKTGAIQWKKEFYAGRPPGGRHRKNSFTSETPVTDGKLVYVYAENLGIWAYTRSGKLRWHIDQPALPMFNEFGTGGSAVLHRNSLIVLSDNEKQQFLAAYDKHTGQELWRTNRDIKDPKAPRRSGWTTPYLWAHPLRTEIVTVGPGSTISYDLEGKELWRLNAMSYLTVPSPFAYEGMLYVDAGVSRGLFAVKPGASGDISLPDNETSNTFVAWSNPRAGTYIPTPVAYQGALYVLYDKGIFARFDLKTGQQTYKTRIDPAGAGDFTTSPWAYNGKIFCLNEEGKTFVIKAGETYELLHVNPLEEMALATPALVGDRLLVRTDSRLYSVRRK